MLEQEGKNANNEDGQLAMKDEKLVKSNSNNASRPTFLNTFMASLIDLIVVGVTSTLVVFIIDTILRISGYAFTQKFGMIFVIFMVIMVLYMSIMESGKTSATFGKKASGLFITKR
ncbi:RDD family protein [Clostridium frigoris]|uniref:RDD family protein n=1 Tax=Clostridium frigoris TaxID=205327 RepID=A0ABS6BQP8_9CLOT|nr:RDD family protein [Clostridium frigoris]MBU3159112.1 RDD family protein [Clostridium frigoris]